jgi:hypothetical protein
MSLPQIGFFQKLNVVNQSTVITDSEVIKMVAALNQILPAFARDWKMMTVPASIIPNSQPLLTGSSVLNVIIMDDTDIPGTAGYHNLYNGTATVKVFANTIITGGGTILYEDTRTKATVSQVLTHEVLEALIDPKCTQWQLNPSTGTMYALEVGDPVNGNVKVVRLNDGTRVTVTDWVLPAWYDVQNTIGPYNTLDTLSAPFTLAPTGYLMTTSGGSVTYVYGAAVPEVTKSYLQLSIRTLTRVAAVKGL